MRRVRGAETVGDERVDLETLQLVRSVAKEIAGLRVRSDDLPVRVYHENLVGHASPAGSLHVPVEKFPTPVVRFPYATIPAEPDRHRPANVSHCRH
jgi:hypothetical protein